MTLGYLSDIVADAMQQINDILKGIDHVYQILTRATETEQYHLDVSEFRYTARQSLTALDKQYEYFKKFVIDNRTKLTNFDYYDLKVQDLFNEINLLKIVILTPDTATLSGVLPGNVDPSFTGTVKAVDDGDTIAVITTDNKGNEVQKICRFSGIDSPEKGTPDHPGRGWAAKLALEELILGKEITCYVDPHNPFDTYQRWLTTPYLGDLNICIWSLENCWSKPATNFGRNRYVDADEYKAAAKKCVMGGWPPDGVIKVTSSPTHATIEIVHPDGSVTTNDELTPCDIRLPSGEYVLILSASNRSSVSTNVSVVGNIKKDLPPINIPDASSNIGTVVFNTDPSDLRSIVSIDGDPIAIAPCSLDLEAGKSYEVMFVTPGGYANDISTITPVFGSIVTVISQPKKL
jgi:endonuclease YncB( thermonuclease family)